MKYYTTLLPFFWTFILFLSSDVEVTARIGNPIVFIACQPLGFPETRLTPISDDTIKSKGASNYHVRFYFRMKMILIEVVVGKKRGFLILDTGLNHLALNKKYFSGFSSGIKISGVNTNIDNVQLKPTKVKLGDMPVYKTTACLIDMDYLEHLLEMEVLGVCGVDYINKFQWIIDYRKKEIFFYPIDKFGDLLDSTLLAPSETIHLGKIRHILYVKARVGVNTIRLGLDTGASTTFLDEKNEEKLNGHLIRINTNQNISITGINERKQSGHPYVLRDFNIGNTNISKTRVTIGSINTINKGERIKLDGIFNPIELRHPLIGLNWIKQQLSIWEPDDLLNSEGLMVSSDLKYKEQRD